jgi:hypothetical protein
LGKPLRQGGKDRPLRYENLQFFAQGKLPFSQPSCCSKTPPVAKVAQAVI